MKLIIDLSVPDFPELLTKGNGQPYMYDDDEAIPQDVLEIPELPVIVQFDFEDVIKKFQEDNVYSVINDAQKEEIARDDE